MHTTRPLPLLTLALALIGIAVLPAIAGLAAPLAQAPDTLIVELYNGASVSGTIYNGCADTYMDRGDPGTTHDQSPYAGTLNVRWAGPSVGDDRSVLINFDLWPLPANAAIVSVTLTLLPTYRSGAAQTISVYRVRRNWYSSQATWNVARAGQPWGAPGANNTTTNPDRDADPVTTVWVSVANDPVVIDVTGLVAGWAGGQFPMFGMLLRGEGSLDSKTALTSFVSSDAQVDARSKPRLTIAYRLPTPTPTWTATDTPTITPTEGPTATETPTPTPGPPVATLVLQNGLNGYAGCIDTYLDSSFGGTSNYGKSQFLDVKAPAGKNILIRCDLNSPPNDLPSWLTVVGATLELSTTWRLNTTPAHVNSYRLLRPWVETETTWNIARRDDPWGEPGALMSGVDRAPEANAGVDIDDIGVWLAQDWTDFVIAWQAAPALNYGAVITANAEALVTYRFASSDNPTPDIRPRLVIRYLVPSITPTPTATRTPSSTPSPTATNTPANTPSSTPTATFTLTPTPTPSATATSAPAITPTPTGTTPPSSLALVPADSFVSVGNIFTLDIQAGAGELDTVSAYIDFDPTLLQVVNAAGQPAYAIEMNPDAFSFATVNFVDADLGHIDFSATRYLPPNLIGFFRAATIRFRARSNGTASLVFAREGDRYSDLTLAGESLNPVLHNAGVFIGATPTRPARRAWLPLVLKARLVR